MTEVDDEMERSASDNPLIQPKSATNTTRNSSMNLASSKAQSDLTLPDGARGDSAAETKPDRDELLEILFERSGGFSYFQLFAWFVIQCSASCGGFWWYGLGFML